MKALTLWCAIAAAFAFAAAAAETDQADEPAIRAEFERETGIYIRTTQKDLESNINYPNVTVSLLSADIEKKGSMVAPYAGKVQYLIEYDDLAVKGERKSHPYLMRCEYFDGRWNIDPHGHRMRKNVTDLDKKKSEILFPNI